MDHARPRRIERFAPLIHELSAMYKNQGVDAYLRDKAGCDHCLSDDGILCAPTAFGTYQLLYRIVLFSTKLG